MKAKQIMTALANTQKGSHVSVKWQRVCKTFKTCAHIVTKRTEAFVRCGIDYANLATVKQGIEQGTRDEVGALPFGEWLQFPFIIGHKGVEYVRLYPATFANLPPRVEYAIDGKPATFADVEPFLLASEKPRTGDDKPACFTVKAESVFEVDGQTLASFEHSAPFARVRATA